MNKKTLKALKGSIAKWEAIVNGTGEDHGWTNCPLCALFWEDRHCDGCPVKEKTGKSGCADTPYVVWADTYKERATTPELVALAQAEVDFLRSLLPDTGAQS